MDFMPVGRLFDFSVRSSANGIENLKLRIENYLRT